MNTEIINNDLAPYLFHQGTNFEAYKYFGVHSINGASGKSYVFRVWAPNAYNVFLAGDFNSWQKDLPMTRIDDAGIWEIIITPERDIVGDCYKYIIIGNNGEHYKFDPYAVYGETLKNTASYVYELSDFEWHDKGWLKHRSNISKKGSKNFYPAPMNIYEMHLGSWKTRDGKTNVDGDAYLNYREIADDLVKYVKSMGYTHVELMPIAEHPFDGSWGYQVCGYYAPTSRYGSPEDFRYFVDTMHQNGIGVILDWVPAHFPKDEHGLYEFDGSLLYEYQGTDRMEHRGWGTRCFDVGRPEIQSFLISNAVYWFDEYHVDGLRVDAVASMLYLDFDKDPNEWVPNAYGDNKNLEAIAFFQKLNTAVFAKHPDILMIAEESASWNMITHPVSHGGLGFNFKWNMGWANDSYEYLEMDPFFRQNHHTALTFPMMYAYTENYILPVSHDEVVHGKKSLLDKCSGDYKSKFSTFRAFMTYMMTYPGKKMMFMGQEYGQFREWDYENQLEWFMLDYDMHSRLMEFTRDLNHLYLKNKPLWELDFSWDGFEWIYPDLKGWNTIAYRRFDASGNEIMIVVNFSPEPHNAFEIDVLADKYELVFFSSDETYSDEDIAVKKIYNAKEVDGQKRIVYDLPPLSATVFKPRKSKK